MDSGAEHLPFRSLEYIAYKVASYRCIVVIDDFSIIANVSGYGLLQPHEKSCDRRLTAAIATAQADEFTFADSDVDMLQDRNIVPIIKGYISQFQHFHTPFRQ